jgi:hypothetical protein
MTAPSVARRILLRAREQPPIFQAPISREVKRFVKAPLVVVPVAHLLRLGVEYVVDSDIRCETLHVDHSVHGDGVAECVLAVDTRSSDAGGVSVLPDAEVVVDESVVEEEDGVGGRGVDVGHDAANAIVAVGVGTTLGAGSHVLIGRIDVGVMAGVNPGLVGVGGQRGVAVALQAMGAADGGAGADVDGNVGESLVIGLEKRGRIMVRDYLRHWEHIHR